jgi:hypothetical protein
LQSERQAKLLNFAQAGMAFRFIHLDDEPRLAGWILAIGVFSVAVGSEGS